MAHNDDNGLILPRVLRVQGGDRAAIYTKGCATRPGGWKAAAIIQELKKRGTGEI